MTQRDLAASIVRTSGSVGISTAYLNDIEHDRRTPSSADLVAGFARVLDLDPDYLLFLAGGQLPADLTQKASSVDQKTYRDALALFRQALERPD